MSMLKRSAFVGLVLFALVPLNEAACWMERIKKGVTHCQDSVDKNWHTVGSSWTNSKCDQCSCKADSMRCCQGLPSSVQHPEDCTVEYDYDTCTYEVFKKSDRTIACPYGAVGK